MTTLSVNLSVALSGAFRGQIGLQQLVADIAVDSSVQLSPGIGAGQINEMWTDEFQVSTGTQTIDLYGVLTDIFGAVIDFTAIKALVVINNGTPNGSGGFTLNSGANLIVGGGGSGLNAWGAPFNGNQAAELALGPGDIIVLTNQLAGLTVTPATSYTLQFGHTGSFEIDYSVALFGVA